MMHPVTRCLDDARCNEMPRITALMESSPTVRSGELQRSYFSRLFESISRGMKHVLEIGSHAQLDWNKLFCKFLNITAMFLNAILI